ncbi:MAG TPA: glycosyltransferase, partial [Aggregatilineaceae bacterium]|nr:glycosyltransferase [Aggregatilineaceae bacterium]
LSRYHTSASKIRVIHQAAADIFHHQPLPSKDAVRRTVTLGYVGWTGETKGSHILVEVINRLSQSQVTFSFKWVTHPASIEQLISSLSPLARLKVDFIPWMAQEELVSLLDSCDVFVFPSLFEGFGKAALEAMVRGLCVVVGSGVGMRDLITHDKNGLIVPSGDTNALFEILYQLLEHPERISVLQYEAQKSTRQRYTWERVAAETVKFYEDLAAVKWSKS